MATALLGVWLVRNWLAGVVRVAAVSADTVDGAAVGWTLSLLVWGMLALAFLLAVRAGRRREGSGGLRGPAGDGSGPATDGSAVPLKPGTQSRRASRRTTTAGWIAAGAIFVAAVYHGLILPGAITWGDWGYFVNASAVRAFFPVPSLWSFADLGTANILGGALAPIESAMGAMAWVGIPYTILERLWFYLPAVALSYSGAVLLARRLGAQAALAALAGAFYATNPYALILVSGGQLTVGVGYALFPWVAVAGLATWSKGSVRAGIALGALVGVQAWFDPRTAGLSVAGMVVALLVLAAGTRRPVLRRAPWRALSAAALVFVLAQGPWLVPALLAVPAHLPAGYTTTPALQTLSLMSLADGLTVFHPFWPTMQFIALHSVPVLWLLVPAMVGVALARAPLSRGAQVGAAVYLVFAALVSGANMPFGAINSWLFSYVPGMDLFRDPSPYFGPAALGVVVVVAAGFAPRQFAGAGMAAVRHNGRGRSARNSSSMWRRLTGIGPRASTLSQFALGLGGAALVVVSAWPALSGALGHNLAPRAVPARYAELAQEILRGPAGAVLWVPSTSSFAPVSPAHPSVSAFSLEGMIGAAFPATPQGLDWLGVPSLVSSILQQYDIRTVVVRDDAVAYRELSLPSTVRTATLASLTSLRDSRTTALPGLTVFHLDPAPYPLTAFSRTAGLPASVTKQRPGDELTMASFPASLPGWQPVGDGNNYLHQTLTQAGISESVGGRGSFVRLTVRYGAAVISRPLSSCPSEGLQQLRVRYRTTGSASLTALIFSSAQAPPVATLTLPATAGWTSVTSPFVLAPTLSTWDRHVPLTDCVFVLSGQPSRAGAMSSVEVRSLLLSAAAHVAPNCAATAIAPSPAWCHPTPPRVVDMTAGGDALAATLPPASRTRLLVFWQQYNQGWIASTRAGRLLRRVRVDGWANGFLVPGAAQATLVHVMYQPQDLVVYGYGALLCAMVIIILSGLTLLLDRRSTRLLP
ncbi:MAG TPA: hypothetical protein VNH38_04020 [Candidatus Dormibacteraeota bacterium]|nr:hypothetical protein [Candidatus Dormibacteraeota bacterium]